MGRREALQRAARVVAEGLAVEALASADAEPRREPVRRDTDEALALRRAGRAPVDDRGGPHRGLDIQSRVEPIAPLPVELLGLQDRVRAEKREAVAIFDGARCGRRAGHRRARYRAVRPARPARRDARRAARQERSPSWFRRLLRHLPSGGAMAFSDLGWYDRAMVGWAMGFCADSVVRAFLRSALELGRIPIRTGIRLAELRSFVSKEERARRLEPRCGDSSKPWRLAPVDVESRQRREACARATEETFFSTWTADAPRPIVEADEEGGARIRAVRVFRRPGRRDALLEVDPRIVRSVEAELGGKE